MVSEPTHSTAPARPPGAPPPQVEVWTVGLDQPAPFIQVALDSLSPEERSRANAFKYAAARQAYIIAHAALRQLLADRLKLAATEVPIQIAAHGKPELGTPFSSQLHFNLSHSGNLALVAICANSEVGVDVEKIRPTPEADRLAKRFFTAAESGALHQLPEAGRDLAFFRIWTRKEALLKATGQGITNGLTRFEVSCEPDGGLIAVEGNRASAAEWSLHSWSPAAGYLGAVAVPQPGATFSFGECEFLSKRWQPT